MNEFDTTGGKTPADPITRIIDAFKPTMDYVAEEREAKVVESVKQGVKEAVDFLGDTEETKTLPEFWRKAALEEYALRNPTMAEAFNNRAQNPQAWQTALKGARDFLAEQSKALPSSTMRTDLEAAAAAVSGRSNQASPNQLPSPIEMAQMSDVDFQKLMDREKARARS